MTNKYDKFGGTLKELRENKRLTQEQFAALIGKSVPAIGQFERGEIRPNFATLEKIIDVLDADVNLLFARESANYPKEAIKIAHLLSSISDEQREAFGNLLIGVAEVLKERTNT